MMLMSRGLPGGQAQSAAIMTQSATKSCPVDAALGSSWAALERFGPRCSVELRAGGDPAALTVPADGGQEQSATKSCPVDACRTWVDSMVIGLSLCPWAKPVRDSGGLRYSVTQAREAEALSAALLHEIDLLQSDPELTRTGPLYCT